MSNAKGLVVSLFGEVFQTERSAIRHCAIEADRLDGTAPSDALRAVSAHATQAEQELEALARARDMGQNALGKAVGSWFSVMRDNLADLTLTSERSYRGTLLGMRHGYDLITLFGAAAEVEADGELGAWARGWLARRAPLVEACARELRWFAQHPDRALRGAKAGG